MLLLATAEGILRYANKELEKAIRVGDIMLYRNSSFDKPLSQHDTYSKLLYLPQIECCA